MKFVDQQPSRMQRQCFLKVGQFGQHFLAGIKKSKKKLAGAGLQAPTLTSLPHLPKPMMSHDSLERGPCGSA
jgi:hypothetical protein